MSTFSENLKAARIAARLTQQQVADSLGISRPTISQWETGAIYPDASRLADIAELLDCSLDRLFRAKPEANELTSAKPEMATFWMIYGVGQRAPTARHWSEDAAKTEALRLATANPGITFVVLEAVAALRSEPRVIEFAVSVDADDGIPF